MKLKTPRIICVALFICLVYWLVLNGFNGIVNTKNMIQKICRRPEFNEEDDISDGNNDYEKVTMDYENSDLLILPDMLEYLSYRNESREAIFYTETSRNGTIKARFVCAIESAARINPNSDIYLLMLVPPYHLNLSENAALDLVLKHHSNIQVLGCDAEILFQNTFVEPFYKSGKLNNSTFKAVHTSDLIRIFILWKYGGKYFDLDVILIKPMTHIKNFVIEQNKIHDSLCNGLLAWEKNSSIGLQVIEVFIKNFDGTSWAANGPGSITGVMVQTCGPILNMTKEKCKGFHILRHHEFFPIMYDKLCYYFNEKSYEDTMKYLDFHEKYLYGYHIGNNLIHNEVVRINSKQPYGLLAQKYCPRAYWSCDKYF